MVTERAEPTGRQNIDTGRDSSTRPRSAEAIGAVHSPPGTKSTVSFDAVQVRYDPAAGRSRDDLWANHRARRAAFVRRAAGVVLGTLIIAFLWYYFSPKQRVLRAIKADHLVVPSGSSAYDLYREYRTRNPRPEDLTDVAAVAIPALTTRTDSVLTQLKDDSVDPNWEDATRLFRWLNELSPSKATESRLLFAQGRQSLAGKDYDRAITFFTRSVQIDGSWALPWNGMARAAVGKNDAKAAEKYYRSATEVEPNWVFPWLNLGSLYITQKRFASAEKALRTAAALDPNGPLIHYRLGVVLERLGRPCGAVAEYGLALQYESRDKASGFDVGALQKKVAASTNKYHCSAKK